jgi:hypothetical protein
MMFEMIEKIGAVKVAVHSQSGILPPWVIDSANLRMSLGLAQFKESGHL